MTRALNRGPRGDRKLVETVQRVETRPIQLQRRIPATDFLGTPGTDFGTPAVPRTTIPPATRISNPAGSDSFIPGQGTAFLFKYDNTGTITPWLDDSGNAVWKPVFNFTEEQFEPNANQTPIMALSDSTDLDLSDGTDLELSGLTASNDYIGDQTPVLVLVMDRQARLTIYSVESAGVQPQPERLERALVAEAGGIPPDGAGDITLYIDQQQDNNPVTATANTITLAVGSVTVDDHYNAWMIRITDGPGKGQTRWIKDYNGTTRVATIAAYKGVIDYDWNANGVPDANSTYKLYKNVNVIGHWSHAENGERLQQYEECWAQKLPLTAHWDIVHGTSKHLQRAVVQQTGGIQDGQDGQIVLSESGVTTTGRWDFATAGKHIRRLTDVYAQYYLTDPSGNTSTLDQGRVYRIVGVDCSGLVDTVGEL